jgi:CcmD family protein
MTQSQPDSGTLTDPSARSTEFVAVQGGGDTTSAATLLVIAYIVMWALLLGFVLLSWRRQGRVESRISELEKSLASGSPKHGAAD